MLMRHWSSAIEALLRHGNKLSSDFPDKIEFKDVDVSTFQGAMDFQCSGKLESAVIDRANTCLHPLLQFADQYDLPDLKKDYVAMASERRPLTKYTAAWH